MAGVASGATENSHPFLGHGRPFVKLAVSGVQTNALIDTGSTHTLISTSLFSKIPQQLPLSRAPRLLSASGDAIQAIGSTIVMIARQPLYAVVCQKLGIDLLLGANVLKDCVLDLTQKVIKFPQSTFPIILSRSK